MRFILSIFLFAALIFGNQKITNPETGEEISLYNKSWAVIIGVNKYEHVKPLDYCVADANSIESLLIENFDFNSLLRVLSIGLNHLSFFKEGILSFSIYLIFN